MQIVHKFTMPSGKRVIFFGWAGPVATWEPGKAPGVSFGKWSDSPVGGKTVAFDVKPFQLCMFGANHKKMLPRHKFTYFAFAGLGADGNLRLHRLPEGCDARKIFESGGWEPPSVSDLIVRIGELSDLDLRQRVTAAVEVVETCNQGFGMGFRVPEAKSLSEKNAVITDFAECAAKWPQLAEIAKALGAVIASANTEHNHRKKRLMDRRKAELDKAVAALRMEGIEVSPLTVAARVLGIANLGEVVPHAVKEQARKLKNEFPGFWAASYG